VSATDNKELIGLLIALIIAAPMVGAYVGTVDDVQTPENVSEDVVLGDDGVGSLSAQNTPVGNLSAEQSLGTALRFTGANDSELIGGSVPSPDENWTVTTWARLNDSASLTSTRRVTQIGGWLYVDYNDSEWRITYYDEADLTVHQVAVNAPDPYNWTHLAVQTDGSNLRVYRNTTLVADVALGSGGASIPDADNWYGTVEETRGFDDNISRSQINATYDHPTRPVQGGDEFVRVMYDLRSGESLVDLFWTGSDAQRMNTTIVAGFDGEPVQGSSDILGADYRFDQDTNTISTVDGGVLDEAPVVFVQYSANVEGTLSGVTGTIARIVGVLLGLLLLATVGAKVQEAI